MSVKYELRCVATVVVISTMSLICAYASASELDDSPTALAALQAKAGSSEEDFWSGIRNEFTTDRTIIDGMRESVVALKGQPISHAPFKRQEQCVIGALPGVTLIVHGTIGVDREGRIIRMCRVGEKLVQGPIAILIVGINNDRNLA